MEFSFKFKMVILLFIIIQAVKFYYLGHQHLFKFNLGIQSLHKLNIMQESNHFNLANAVKDPKSILKCDSKHFFKLVVKLILKGSLHVTNASDPARF